MINLYPSNQQSSGSPGTGGTIRLYPSDSPSKSAVTSPAAAPVSPTAPVSPKPAPITTPPPVSTPSGIPTTAIQGTEGGGYGASNITDPSSGKPLLTYENPEAKSSQLLSDRTAPTFDPTKPQKVDPKVLQDPRMAESVSQAIKKAVGGDAYSELDHIMPLELGGSNNKTNLRLEPADNPSQTYSGNNPTPTDPLENQLATQVHSGNMSLVDAWKAMAKAKGVTLPEDGGAVPNLGQSSIQPNTEPNEQKLSAKDAAGAVATKFFPSTLQSLADLQIDPLSLKGKPQNYFSDYAKSIAQNIEAEGDNIKQAFTAPTISGKIGGGLKTVAGGVGVLFSPVTAFFNAAKDIPVVGTVAKLATLPFAVAGDAGNLEAKAVVNHLPITNDSKTQIADGLGQMYGLVNMLALGKLSESAAREQLTPKFGEQDANTIVEKAKAIAAGAPDIINHETPAAPTSDKPLETTIPPATETNSSLPSWAPAEAKTLETASSQPSNSPAPLADAISARPGETATIPSKSMPAGALRPIEGIGEEKTRSLSSGVLDKAISNTPSRLPGFAPDEAKVFEQKQIATKLTDTFGDLPQYKTMDVADQGARAIDLFQKDPESARQIAYGAKAPPKGLTPEAVFIAVEQDAIERGDGQTLRELANSRLTSEATTMGQRLRMLAERNPESPTEAIRSVQAAREKAVEAKNAGKNVNVVRDKVTNDITTEIKRASLKPKDFASFVESITC